MSIRELKEEELATVSGEGTTAKVLLAGAAICAAAVAVTASFPALAAAAAAYKVAGALFSAGAGVAAFMDGE